MTLMSKVFHVAKDSGSEDSSGMLDYKGEPGNLYISLKGDASIRQKGTSHPYPIL
jgi:hypothetical protein